MFHDHTYCFTSNIESMNLTHFQQGKIVGKISVTIAKKGRITLSKELAHELDIVQGNSLSIFQNSANKDDWYISFDYPNDCYIRVDKKGTTYCYNRPASTSLLNHFLHEESSYVFFIDLDEPIELDNKKHYKLNTSQLAKKRAAYEFQSNK